MRRSLRSIFLNQWRVLVALTAIVIFAWLIRLYQLGEPTAYVFDEAYHVPAIRLIAAGDARAFEWWHGAIYGGDIHDWLHPPMAKYIQAGFFEWFGQTAFSWRLASAVFGTLGVVLTFVVAQLLFRETRLSLLAALLLSLDGLWLVQSRVAMNDVFAVVWLLAGTVVYLWYQRTGRLRWLLPAGVLFGIAVASKWSALFWLGGLIAWELFGFLRSRRFHQLPWLFFSLLAVPAGVYLMSFLPMLLQGKTVTAVFQLHGQILLYQLYGSIDHAYQSTVWQWLVNWRPVLYWSDGMSRAIYALNNPLLVLLQLLAVGMSLLVVLNGRVQRTVGQISASLPFLLMLFLASFLPWLFSPRTLFYHHYTPATPLAAMLLAYWLHRLYLTRRSAFNNLSVFVVLICLIWVFWAYYPHWIGLPVSEKLTEALYFALPSWR